MAGGAASPYSHQPAAGGTSGVGRGPGEGLPHTLPAHRAIHTGDGAPGEAAGHVAVHFVAQQVLPAPVAEFEELIRVGGHACGMWSGAAATILPPSLSQWDMTLALFPQLLPPAKFP